MKYMRVTIGELIEFISPWSNRIETFMIYDRPFMKVHITGLYGTTKFYLYITQYKENLYQVIDSDDDINERIFPTGVSDNPFIKEKDIASGMFGLQREANLNFIDNISVDSFKLYLIDKLNQYNIIKFNIKNLKKSMVSDMGFNSIRIKRILTNKFKEYHCRDDTVEELMKIIMDKGQQFDLHPMKQKEVNCIFAILRNLGLNAKIDKDIIKSLSFIRRN